MPGRKHIAWVTLDARSAENGISHDLMAIDYALHSLPVLRKSLYCLGKIMIKYMYVIKKKYTYLII